MSGPRSQVPRLISSDRGEIRKSFYAKLIVYSRFIDERRSYVDQARCLREEAQELLASQHDTRLRALAKEVDVWVREVLDPPEQFDVIAEMVSGGVHGNHLPKIPSLRRLRAILKRGAIRSAEDLGVARFALDTRAFGQLSESELLSLGRLFDEYTVRA